MNEPILQHLVPQWYLRRFADSKNRIRRINKDGSINEVRSIKRIAAERNFYTFDEEGMPSFAFEEALSVIEGRAAGATRRMVRDGFPLREMDRDALSFFLAMQIERGRYSREWLDGFMDWALSTVDPTETRRDSIHWPEEDFAIEDGKVRLSRRTKLDLAFGRASLVSRILFSRPWQIVQFAEPVLFTSDQPVSFFDPDRTVPTSALYTQEFRWPADREHALIIGPPGPGNYSWRLGTAADVDSINANTADWSYEWTYDHPDGPTNEIYERWLASTTESERLAQQAAARQRPPFPIDLMAEGLGLRASDKTDASEQSEN